MPPWPKWPAFTRLNPDSALPYPGARAAAGSGVRRTGLGDLIRAKHQMIFAMLRRRRILKLALLTTALGLITLCLSALACAPDTPSGQTAGQAQPDTAPEVATTATPTSEPTATATPTSEPTATATATPKPTISSKIEPMFDLLATQSPSAAGQTARMVNVRIWPAEASRSVSNANWTNLRQLVADNGGDRLSGQEFSVPVSLLPQLSAHPAAARVTVIWQEEFPYPNMSRALNNVVAVWQAGATPQQAAAAYSPVVYGDKIFVIIAVADTAAFNRAEAFFTANGVFIAPELRDKYLESLGMFALAPVPLLVELSQVAGIAEISDFGEPPVPEGESISVDVQARINFILYPVLPPNLRSRLSPLPTELWAWDLEGITPTPAPAPSLE